MSVLLLLGIKNKIRGCVDGNPIVLVMRAEAAVAAQWIRYVSQSVPPTTHRVTTELRDNPHSQ